MNFNNHLYLLWDMLEAAPHLYRAISQLSRDAHSIARQFGARNVAGLINWRLMLVAMYVLTHIPEVKVRELLTQVIEECVFNVPRGPAKVLMEIYNFGYFCLEAEIYMRKYDGSLAIEIITPANSGPITVVLIFIETPIDVISCMKLGGLCMDPLCPPPVFNGAMAAKFSTAPMSGLIITDGSRYIYIPCRNGSRYRQYDVSKKICRAVSMN